MVVHRDLFGGASIIRESGEVGRPGTIRIEHHPDEGTGPIGRFVRRITLTRNVKRIQTKRKAE
jgi:hypothetical protein